MSLEWMAWTVPTAAFFITIAVILTAMTIWQALSPSIERRGLLPIKTTRGDRLFVGLLGRAYIAIAWIGLTDWNIYYSLPVYVVFIGLTLRFG